MDFRSLLGGEGWEHYIHGPCLNTVSEATGEMPKKPELRHTIGKGGDMKGERRYSKEPGVKVCDAECMFNKRCPVPDDKNPCLAAKAKKQSKMRDVVLID